MLANDDIFLEVTVTELEVHSKLPVYFACIAKTKM